MTVNENLTPFLLCITFLFQKAFEIVTSMENYFSIIF